MRPSASRSRRCSRPVSPRLGWRKLPASRCGPFTGSGPRSRRARPRQKGQTQRPARRRRPALRTRGPGRPSKTADYRELVASILEAQPGLKTLEVLRRARLAGYGGGKTALYSLVRELRPRAVRPICRFEGVAGEFTQHDFGEVRVRWRGNGQLERVQFFCSRLKYSRFALVVVVDNQRTETLVRSLAEHFERMGGIPLLAVFDSVPRHRIELMCRTAICAPWPFPSAIRGAGGARPQRSRSLMSLQ